MVGAVGWIALTLGLVVQTLDSRAGQPAARPNILWITCEDISPNLGCYGDSYAVTPNLDKLASQGVRYTKAFAPIGVCAPSRSSLITGLFACSIGTHAMRSQGVLPESIRCFPEYLRDAGYYCTNNVKTDYNFKHRPETWDESSNKAHWRGRKPGQPFFAVFNFTTCHESQIRLAEPEYQKRVAGFSSQEKHDPAKVTIPPYHPDTPEVRQDWARYADMITFMDKQAGGVLKQLEEEGLADNTVVCFFSDHGAGMPRSKRWLYETSTRVPFIVRFPEKFKSWTPGEPGGITNRMVSFVDFGPSVLSLAGIDVPDTMQGRAFLGPKAGSPREYVYGFRDRMDERTDMLRSVRDSRYRYIRNYYPDRPYFHSQHLSYAIEMPTLRVWQGLAEKGKLSGAQAVFMAKSKPSEELYDTEEDPYEVRNLAGLAEYEKIQSKLSTQLDRWQVEIKDLGFLPEGDLRTRFGDKPAYQAVRETPGVYPIDSIMSMAKLAGRRDPSTSAQLREGLEAKDPATRYWAAVGLGAIGDAGKALRSSLEKALKDEKGWVRVAAADALAKQGEKEIAVTRLIKAMSDSNGWVRLQAIEVLDRLGKEARQAREVIHKALEDSNEYVVRVAKHAVQAFEPISSSPRALKR